MQAQKDSRAKPINRTQLGLENQDRVFKVFDDECKLTVRDVYETLRTTSKEGRPLAERTVRRAIESLEGSGFLVQVGRTTAGANLYTKQSTAMVNPSNGIIPLNGELVSVEKFLRFIAESEEPFKLKHQTLSPKTTLGLRKALLFTIITAGEAGHDENLKTVHLTVQKYIDELTYVLNLLKGFADSPVWYSTYRDRIGLGVRDTQKNDAELLQLCIDIVKGG